MSSRNLIASDNIYRYLSLSAWGRWYQVRTEPSKTIRLVIPVEIRRNPHSTPKPHISRQRYTAPPVISLHSNQRMRLVPQIKGPPAMTICTNLFPVQFIPLKTEPKNQRQVWESETGSQDWSPRSSSQPRAWIGQQLERHPKFYFLWQAKMLKSVPDQGQCKTSMK